MPTAVTTDHERAAVQAYLRLLHTVRAALDKGPTPGGPPLVPDGVLEEADRALAVAGLAGNEREFFSLLRMWCPPQGG